MNHDDDLEVECMLAELLDILSAASSSHTLTTDLDMTITSKLLALVSLIAAVGQTQSTVGPVVNLGYAQVHFERAY
jgi:hypothetical protein